MSRRRARRSRPTSKKYRDHLDSLWFRPSNGDGRGKRDLNCGVRYCGPKREVVKCSRLPERVGLIGLVSMRLAMTPQAGAFHDRSVSTQFTALFLEAKYEEQALTDDVEVVPPAE